MLAVLPDRLGCESPRIFTPPLRPLTRETTRGFEAIDFATDVLGIELLPWQKWLLIHALELTPDGKFRFRTVIVLVARQNGKTLLLNVLSLWRLFVDGAGLVIGTAQDLEVAEDTWLAAVELVESIPDLKAEIEHVDKVNGKKNLRLVPTDGGGRRSYKVKAANRRGGRGKSADLAAMDELREHHNWDAWAAVTKTGLARPRPQTWGLSNAGDRTSVVLAHMRSKATAQILDGQTENVIGLFEWSAPDGCDKYDPDGIAQANPSVGVLIPWQALYEAAENDPDDVYRTECLCQWVDQMDPNRITLPMWDALRDPTSAISSQPVVAVVVRRDRSGATLVAAGRRLDGDGHVEVIESRPGTAWVVARAIEVAKKHRATLVLAGPSVTLEPDFIKQGVEPTILNAAQRARASAWFYDAIKNGKLRQRGEPELAVAVTRARRRMVGDGWEWESPDATVDITAVQGASVALWLAQQGADRKPRSLEELMSSFG